MTIKDLVEKVSDSPSEYFWKFLSIIVSSFVFIPNIMIVMFLVYMAEVGFFSYDFFIDGLFGMKWFFRTTAFFLIVLSIITCGPIILILRYKKNAQENNRITFYFSLLSVSLVSFLIWFMIIYRAWYLKDTEYMMFLLLICLCMSIHFSTLWLCSAKTQFKSLLAITALIIFSSLNYPTQAAKVTSIGLRIFGVGGGLPITIISEQTGYVPFKG